MDTKALKELILAHLLNGSLNEGDLNGLVTITNITKNLGIDIFVAIPDEVKEVSNKAKSYALRFLPNSAAHDRHNLGLNLDKFFQDITIERIASNKIPLIKLCREYTNVGLKDAKDLVEEVFGV